jgi:hypothetical protein
MAFHIGFYLSAGGVRGRAPRNERPTGRDSADVHQLQNRRMPTAQLRLFCALLVAGLLINNPAAAQLWDGQSAARAWVQFDNGAWGAVIDEIGDDLVIEYWDGNQAQTTTYGRPANTNHPLPSPGKWTRYAGWAAGLVANPLLAFILYPDQLGNGDISALCGGGPNCLATGYRQCEFTYGGSCSGGWAHIAIPCQWEGSSPAVAYFTYDVLGTSAAGSYCDVADFPGGNPPSPFWRVEGINNWPSIYDGLGLPDPLTTAQADALTDPLNGAGMWAGTDPTYDHPLDVPGFTVTPDIWEPIALPSELPQALPADVMNPNGFPANGVGVITDPVAVPTPTPWPGGVEWPQSHPSPAPSSSPSVVPSGNPGTDPGTGQQPVDVTVNFPDRLDARIVDTDIVTQAGDGDSTLLEDTIDVGGILDFGTGWLPRTCPDLSVSVVGQTIAFGSQDFCDFLSMFGFMLMALTAVGALRYGLGGM